MNSLPENAIELLENYCDFALNARPSALQMLPDSDELQCIAGDGMGGCFYLWNNEAKDGKSPVVYLSSYGEASRFAKDFSHALGIVTHYPEAWSDLLVAATKGKETFEYVLSKASEDIDEEAAEAKMKLLELLPEIENDPIREMYNQVNRSPEFKPSLDTEDGKVEAESFRSRPYPATPA